MEQVYTSLKIKLFSKVFLGIENNFKDCYENDVYILSMKNNNIEDSHKKVIYTFFIENKQDVIDDICKYFFNNIECFEDKFIENKKQYIYPEHDELRKILKGEKKWQKK